MNQSAPQTHKHTHSSAIRLSSFLQNKRQSVRLLISLVLFAGVLMISGCSSPKTSPSNKLLLVSFDGFRYNYFSKTETPNFDNFIANGVKAKRMIPVFPSLTFPNHYSIVTGLYPEHSGIVGNTMYDPKFDGWYRISDSAAVTNAKWYNGEPIWNTVQKQGLKAGVFFWPGSEAPIEGMRPDYWKPYDGSVPNKARIDSVVKWLSYPGQKAVDFGAVYFSLVDHAGHEYGPSSSEVAEAVHKADQLVGYLKNKLKEKDLWHHTNIIIISDHGMADLSADKTIMLPAIINMDHVKRIIWGATTMIWPKEDHLDSIYDKLKQNETHYHIYKKKELPDRYHLDNRRVAPLVMVADLGYTILSKKYKQQFLKSLPAGTHGYDNHDKEMQAIFLAHGPAFKKDVVVDPFQNIHIYDLMAHLLNIKPAPNDGSLDNIRVVLRKK